MSDSKPIREWYGQFIPDLTPEEIEDVREWADHFEETNNFALRDEARIIRSLLAVIDRQRLAPQPEDYRAILEKRRVEIDNLRAELVAAKEERRYRIWSFEHLMWWRPNGNGYTTMVEEAGIYSEIEAFQLCADANHHITTAEFCRLDEAMVPMVPKKAER